MAFTSAYVKAGASRSDPADVAFFRHDLPDKLGLGFQNAPHVRVERALGDVSKDFHFGILVPLAQNPALSLLDVGRPPRGVDVMERDQAFLNVRPGAHHLGASHQHPDPPGSHLFEKGNFGGVRIAILNESNFLGGNAFLNELGLQVIIGRKPFYCSLLRRRKIAKDELRQSFVLRLLPNLENLPR